MFSRNKWWGYIHSESGQIHVKRYFERLDIDEAYTSPFCVDVRGPIDASTREEAMVKLYPDYMGQPTAAHA